MATLQNIRSKGPLLVIVIGLALFAFIAGDAWKVLQPHQSQDVGEVNGESISAQDYQALVEEYTEVIKFSSGNSALNDEQTNQIKDEVWRTYINNKLIEREAKKTGTDRDKSRGSGHHRCRRAPDAATNTFSQSANRSIRQRYAEEILGGLFQDGQGADAFSVCGIL